MTSVVWCALALAFIAAVAFVVLALARRRDPGFASERFSKQQKRKVLVLDLDETLVHTVFDDQDPSRPANVLLRPGVAAFLSEARSLVDELVLFTAGTKPYATEVLKIIDPSGTTFDRAFFRDSCTPVQGLSGAVSYTKDMRKVSPCAGTPRCPDDVRIVDNTPFAYAMQPQLGVPIASYYGTDVHDAELARVAAWLRLWAAQGRGGAVDRFAVKRRAIQMVGR